MTDYIYFGATKGFYALSNFYASSIMVTRASVTTALTAVCPNVLDFFPADNSALVFPTSEHLWQALKALDAPTFLRFTTSGDLGRISSTFLQRVFPRLSALKLKVKMVYWARHNTAGIIAKMAGNETHARALGLVAHMDYNREHLSPEVELGVWLFILKAKFNQNAPARTVLRNTRTQQLIEYDRFAGPARPAHWGGKVDDATRITYGDNVMGKYLMLVRESLQ